MHQPLPGFTIAGPRRIPRRDPACRGTTGPMPLPHRLRLPDTLDESLRRDLVAVSRVAALLRSAVTVFAAPSNVGGDSLQGPTYAERATAGDRTLLDPFLFAAIDELERLAEINTAAIESARAVGKLPGTRGKVETMAWRVAHGLSPFCEDDAR